MPPRSALLKTSFASFGYSGIRIEKSQKWPLWTNIKSRGPSKTDRYIVCHSFPCVAPGNQCANRVSHNSVTSHTQISDLFEGLILRSHPIGSKSKCNRVSQPPRRLWYSITLGLWPRCLRTSKFLSSVDLPRNCMLHECFLIPRLFSKMIVHLLPILVPAPTPWTQTRKPRTVTILATGRWTNDQDNSYHGKRRRKKRKKLRRSSHCHCSTDRSIQNEMCSC